jgi:hypothetical protein
MNRDFVDRAPELHQIVMIAGDQVGRLQTMIESCEHCNSAAEIPFDLVLDGVTGRDPSATDYILESPAHCPGCRSEVTEKTLVSCE